METHVPQYYSSFRCLAGECPHTCCAAGWEIPVDPDTAALYKTLPGPLGDRVRAFAEGGGTLVLTYRTAVKDEDNNLPIGEAPPVGFRELAGVTVEETESLQEAEAFSLLGQGDFAGREGRGGIFRDMLSVQDAEILYRDGDAFYEDRAAVTRRRQGAGSVYYLGCGLDEGTAAGLAEAILKERGIETLSSPEGVEIVDRGAGEDAVHLYLNHNGHAVFAGGKELAAYGCRIERRAAPRT